MIISKYAQGTISGAVYQTQVACIKSKCFMHCIITPSWNFLNYKQSLWDAKSQRPLDMLEREHSEFKSNLEKLVYYKVISIYLVYIVYREIQGVKKWSSCYVEANKTLLTTFISHWQEAAAGRSYCYYSFFWFLLQFIQLFYEVYVNLCKKDAWFFKA